MFACLQMQLRMNKWIVVLKNYKVGSVYTCWFSFEYNLIFKRWTLRINCFIGFYRCMQTPKKRMHSFFQTNTQSIKNIELEVSILSILMLLIVLGEYFIDSYSDTTRTEWASISFGEGPILLFIMNWMWKKWWTM